MVGTAHVRLCPPYGIDLPVVSSPLAKNISLLRLVETAIEPIPSRAHQEGRTRRHERGARDAMDVRWRRKTSELPADGQAAWFWRLDAGVKFVDEFTNDGGKKARSPGRARSKP
jgi:hypothetical protein